MWQEANPVNLTTSIYEDIKLATPMVRVRLSSNRNQSVPKMMSFQGVSNLMKSNKIIRGNGLFKLTPYRNQEETSTSLF